MCFDSENNAIFTNNLDEIEIELITTNNKKNYLNAIPETLQFWLKIVILILHVLSIICLAIHVCKFFLHKTPLNLATKNLTLYCFLMLLVYLWIPTEAILVKHPKIISDELHSLITIYLLLMPVFIKFIIAIDLCLCFRQARLYLRPLSQDPQIVKFTIDCIITVGMPLGILFVAYLIGGLKSAKCLYNATKMIIRIIRIIPIGAAFWYIGKSGINKKGFYEQYSLHIRLLILIGAVPSILVAIQWIFQPKLYHASEVCNNKTNFNLFDLAYTIVVQLRFLLDGFAIGIWFTFKKGTFQSANNARIKFQESQSRKISEVSAKLNNSAQNSSETDTAV